MRSPVAVVHHPRPAARLADPGGPASRYLSFDGFQYPVGFNLQDRSRFSDPYLAPV
jgi:hypothetical protein